MKQFNHNDKVRYSPNDGRTNNWTYEQSIGPGDTATVLDKVKTSESHYLVRFVKLPDQEISIHADEMELID